MAGLNPEIGADKDEWWENDISDIGGYAGAALGGVLGGAAGTLVGPEGTVAGATGGAMVGKAAGKAFTKGAIDKIQDWWNPEVKERRTENLNDLRTQKNEMHDLDVAQRKAEIALLNREIANPSSRNLDNVIDKWGKGRNQKLIDYDPDMYIKEDQMKEAAAKEKIDTQKQEMAQLAKEKRKRKKKKAKKAIKTSILEEEEKKKKAKLEAMSEEDRAYKMKLKQLKLAEAEKELARKDKEKEEKAKHRRKIDERELIRKNEIVDSAVLRKQINEAKLEEAKKPKEPKKSKKK